MVSEIELWPTKAWICLGEQPSRIKVETQVCLRTWRLVLGGSPILLAYLRNIAEAFLYLNSRPLLSVKIKP